MINFQSLLWWLLKIIESDGNNHCLFLALELGLQCWMFWERLTQCTPILHSKGGSEAHMKSTLCKFNEIIGFVVLLRLQSSMECNSIQKGKVSNPRKYF